jgi:diguanylate cyclase (GGDEF)-like protein
MRRAGRRFTREEREAGSSWLGALGDGLGALLWSVGQPVALVRVADGRVLAGNDAYGAQVGDDRLALDRRGGEPVLAGWEIRRLRVGGEDCVVAVRLAVPTTPVPDRLTGLAGRAQLTRAVDRALARAQGGGGALAVASVDLDGFKRVNDELGVAAGDRLLAACARCLLQTVRPEDTVARFGGDEFVVLAEPIADDAGALAFAERLRVALAGELREAGRGLVQSASIGVAVSDGVDESADALLRDADAAMYQAKGAGRDRVVLLGTDLRARLRARASLEGDLRVAIQHEGVQVALQPVVEVSTGRLVGAEALARWSHPARGAVAPGEFVALAERSRLIGDLGARVLEATCQQAAAWRSRRPQHPMWWAVNVSPLQLQDPGFPDLVKAALDAAALPPGDLRIEITETALIERYEDICATLEALRATGIRIMLDDFGTGMSSLAHLRELPVDTIKLDRAFVQHLLSSKDRMIVGSVVQMARLTGLEVIAEGVEQDRDIRFLRALRCHFAQGYRYAPPLPAGELHELPAVLGPPPAPHRRQVDEG